MKKINYIKMALDLSMAVIFVLLFNTTTAAGLAFHEIAGLAIGVAFIIHIGLNWRWVKQVTLKIFDSQITFKTRLGYIVDVLLLLAMAYIIISGIAISKVVFPNNMLGNSPLFRSSHVSISYLALILIGVHIGLHWTWISNIFRNIFRITGENRILQNISKVLVVLLVIFGVYNLFSASYFSRISPDIRGIKSGQAVSPGSDVNRMERGRGQTFNNENRSPQDQNMRGEFPPRQGRREGFSHNNFKRGSSSTAKTLITFSSIISLFAIATYYIEKFLKAKIAKRV